ncbi:hypothetical protein EC973_007468 [Apophysomyces ossiformis]|uniref:RhoGAP-domain-containing protein n=1 Tax=Apophysomyces ossiformis TaxID=679940 RepID=A0A8H7BP80_9FUNG|nr:hypothetical protein EC973_007468 [Apophysomyces ossiformis]
MQGTLPVNTSPHSPTSTNGISSSCTACQKPLEGEYLRALEGTFHWECFTCLDCHEPVAAKFFPIEAYDGSQKPLCERDYFRRLNLVCDHCGDALRGSYITAVNKKYHLEHFCCSVCGDVFGAEASYYEHDDNVYCHYHYSIKFAVKCVGCQTAILKQFVEINRNNIDEHWHPECYMIHKFWNVKLAENFGTEEQAKQGTDLSQMTASHLKEIQTAMEEKVYRIWTVLSAFEESAAACISDILVHVSEGTYMDGLRMAEYFITHVHVLFGAIDDLANQYQISTKEELFYDREAKMLCKKVTNFFTLLSHTQENGLRRIGVTQELLSLVTGLAHYLKVLIRIGLTGALKLERKYNVKPAAISRFLSNLMELANKQRDQFNEKETTASSELCQMCAKACEEQCFELNNHRWHDSCFACSQCCVPLRNEHQDAFLDNSSLLLYCKQCAGKKTNVTKGFKHVTQLQQLSFLLRMSLKRLYHLLNVPEPVIGHNPLISNQHAAIQQASSSSEAGPNEAIHLQDIKRMKSTYTGRKTTDSQRVAKRSTLMETPSPTTAYVTNSPEEENKQLQPAGNDDTTRSDIGSPVPEALGGKENILNLQDLSQIIAAQYQTPNQNYTKAKPKAKCYYFAELGALDHFMLKHIAVLYLADLLKDHFSLEDLADLIDENKNSTLWTKFVTGLKAGNKKAPRPKEGTFGVPLDVLVDKDGIESNLGAGPTRIKIPTFIDESISAMKQMDMSIEGIFRKNGNIRRLKELTEEIDRNPNTFNLMNETPVQVAALIKKFLRELPDPLLTFKLHKLFITAQKLESEADRKRVTHLACCLLPKPNRDTMEVLFLFMKWVATFAFIGEDAGSKMDVTNLATVLAPNILYSKSKDPMKDDSFCSIEAVRMLLQYQEEFASVPEDFVPLLQNLTYAESDMDLNVRHILKKCETVMKLKRSPSGGDIVPPGFYRQHSSPAAVSTGPSTPSPMSPTALETHASPHSYFSSSPVDIPSSPSSTDAPLVHPMPVFPGPVQRSHSSSEIS